MLSVGPQILIRHLLFAHSHDSSSPVCLSSLSLPLPPSPVLGTCQSLPRWVPGEPTSWGNGTLTPAPLFHPREAPVWVSSFPLVPQSPTPLTHSGARFRAQGPEPCGESQPYSPLPHPQFQRVQTAWPEKGVPCLGLLTGYGWMSLSHSPIWPSSPSSL